MGELRRLALPKRPRAIAFGFHPVEGDLVLQGVHRLPKALMPQHSELALCDKPLERLLDQFLAFFDHVEHVAAKAEEAPVDPELGIADLAKARYDVSRLLTAERQDTWLKNFLQQQRKKLNVKSYLDS